MSFRITGREALSTFDSALRRLREKVAKAIDAADEIEHRAAEVDHQQVDRFMKLADIRPDEISDTSATELDRLHRDAKRLLDEHETYIAEEAERLAQASDAITGLERDRQENVEQRSELLETYESLVSDTENKLKTDKENGRAACRERV